MKSLSKKTRYLIILGSILFVVLFAGLNIPRHIVPAQGDTSPTPTALATLIDPISQSGDTEGLIMGASIILIIILLGVMIQRVLIKRVDQTPQE
jgi:hypothetical protein